MQYEIRGGETKCDVVLGELGLLGVELGLITEKQRLVLEDGRCVDYGSSPVDVHIAIQSAAVVDVSCLQLAGLASANLNRIKADS